MTDLREAAQQALEAWDGGDIEWFKRAYTVMENLRAALAQQDEPVEPVATVVARQYDDGTYAGNALDWAGRNCEDDFPVGTKLYAAPPQRVAQQAEPAQEQDEPVATLTASQPCPNCARLEDDWK